MFEDFNDDWHSQNDFADYNAAEADDYRYEGDDFADEGDVE